jgi:50S ribosomal protein L16 3-hydroxylase
MKKNNLLGSVTTQQFLKKYWQKKPLLIRQAIPDMQPVLSRDALLQMAQHDEVETRLITQFRGNWKLEHGPIAACPKLSQKNWTLLVQGVNLHDDQASALLNQFRFIPDSRLDDLMISYATDGGGVGAHFDSYDVFLLQASGQRRWRISAQKDLTLQPDLPLKILQNFIPDQEFLLEPGDMLYLPPGYAHEGVAVGECMTYSIGYRAPSWQELGESFLSFMADSIELDGMYSDAGKLTEQAPAELGDALIQEVVKQFNKLAFNQLDIELFLGEHFSEPKNSVFFDAPKPRLSEESFAAKSEKRGIKLSRKSRMLYRNKTIFINGLSYKPNSGDRNLLIKLANQRQLEAGALKTGSVDLRESLFSWYCDGWIEIL